MELIRKELSASEFAPVNQRWNSACNCTQQTPDGGTTWVDDPGIDPRTAPGAQLPPDPTENPECDAAARMTAAIKGLVDGYLRTASILEAANALLAIILVLLPGYGVLVDLLLAVVEALAIIGALAIEAAMTPEVYDTLTCILRCNVQSDGSITQDGVDRTYTQVADQLTGVAVDVIGEFLNVLGANGLSNASALRDETGDCDDCDECTWCYQWDNAVELLAEGWTHAIDSTGSQFWDFDYPAGFPCIEASFDWTCSTGTGGDSAAAIWAAASFGDRVQLLAPLGATSGHLAWTGTHVFSGASFGLNAAAGSGGAVTVANFRLRGTGTRPAWTHGHEC